jgi:phage gp36-like protein
MAYVTAADIVARIGESTALQLTTDSGSSVDTALISAIIAEVEADVETALRKRFRGTLTESAYPQSWALVRGKVIDMVIYRLGARRPEVPEAWQTLYKNAVAWLDKLAAGNADLPDVAANAPDADYEFRRDDAGPEDMI